ncbi:MAG: hypothetical protein ACLQJ0_10365 [Steroidobacteraceae bacterium]
MASDNRKRKAKDKSKTKTKTKKKGAPAKNREATKLKVGVVTGAGLARRVKRARDDSAKAFAIRMITGRDPSQIDPKDKLAVPWGYDPQHIDLLADAIDAAHWHHVYISHLEIQACTTIQDVIDLVRKKMS